MMADHALEIRNLYKRFGQVEVLSDICVTMAPGDFLVLVGPSGCGKSTLLNCIAGLEHVSDGSVWIAGKDVTNVPPKDRDIAMVFQSYALYPTMSVADNIGFGMKIRRQPSSEISTKTQQVAGLLKIDHLLDRKPSQLSGGQRQRVAMGRALVRDPSLFLFDEPLSNLDAKLRVEMRAEIKRLHQTTGTSIVYVTHDQVEAMTMATKIVVLKDGKVMQVGTPDDIYNKPDNLFVADFMGSPPMNLVSASVDTSANALVLADGQRLSGVNLPESVATRKQVKVGIRPEDFSRGEGIVAHNVMSEHTGSDIYLNFTVGDEALIARLSGRTDLSGDVRLAVDTAHLVYFDTETGQRL